MTVWAYGDESADATGKLVYAVACVVGPEASWNAAADAWTRRTGGRVFHAATCESEFATDPDQSKHRANLALYRDLVEVLAGSGLVGLGVALDLASHSEYFPGVPRDVGYYKCVTEVVARLSKTVVGWNSSFPTPTGETVPVRFVFDKRRESAHNVGILYRSLVNASEWRDRRPYLAPDIEFDTRVNPRIQMADMFARETMKELEREIGAVKRTRRKSLVALASTGRFSMDLLGPDYVRSWASQKVDIEESIAETGLTVDGYRQWLHREGRRDNWSNRFLFLTMSDGPRQ